MAKSLIAAIGSCAIGCLITVSAQATPLASSYHGKWNAHLTPAGAKTQRIVLGKTRKGNLRVLVRKKTGGPFALMLENRRNHKRRRSGAKGLVLEPSKAIALAQKEMVRRYLSANSSWGFNVMTAGTKYQGKIISEKLIQLGRNSPGRLYKTIYHGLNAEGTAHIVEFRAAAKKKKHQKHPDSTFMNIDLKGNATFAFTVPTYGRGEGHVWATWENHALKQSQR